MWTCARNQCNLLSHIGINIVVIVPSVGVATFVLGAALMAAVVAVFYKVC